MNLKRILIHFSCMFLFAFVTFGATQDTKIEDKFEPGFISIGDESIPFRLYSPPLATSESPKPLLIFLHGAGERGVDNKSQLNHFPLRWFRESHLGARHDAFIFVPQCPKGKWWNAVKRNDKQEFVMDIEKPVPTALLAVEKKIFELIENPAIDKSRIYLTGLSMGGYGSWYLAHRYPNLFAGVVPICGGCDISFAQNFAQANLPIWTIHGAADKIIKVERSREIVHALRKAGANITYTELPNVGHNSWYFAYGPNGVMEWLFGQRNLNVED